MAQIKATHRAAGFTLIELMVVCVIVAILAAIAVPAYNPYIQRGDLVEGTQALSAYRVQMEQYYQDHNTYSSAGTTCGAALPALVNFVMTCATANAGQTYTATATGQAQLTNQFVYTIDETNDQTSTVPTGWSTQSSSSTGWIVR
jgi:type IV pilus assembly protein PilE